MKKSISIICFTFLFLVSSFPSFGYAQSLSEKQKSVQATEEAPLTEDQIIKKFEEINKKYDINESFSKSDADFIKKYAKPAQAPGTVTTQGYASDHFDKSGSASGISANMNGTVWSDLGWISNSYGAEFSTIVKTGHATKIENSVSITAYGLAGAGGIGKVYEDTLTSSNENQDTLYSDMSDTFTASVAYSTVIAKTTVSNEFSSFTLRSH